MSDVDIKHVHEDLIKLKNSVELVKNILAEEYELSDSAKKALKEAREVPDKELISHGEVKKRFL